jgi:hypothetical protein
MSKARLLIAWGALLAAALPAAGAPDPDKRRADALALAARIDRHIDAGWAANKIVPAAPADDAEFLRRVYLHLAGRIPSVHEARRFLADKSPDKRVREVERLLDGQRYPTHLAAVWRALMLPEGGGGGLEAWLRARFAAGVGYDRMVRDLLTATPGQGAEDGTSPLGFYQAKGLKPEEVADTTARLLLGVRLGCAQCHNHPFADWKKEQFWEYAAFFADLPRLNQRQQQPALLGQPPLRELKIPGGDKVAKAKFLDGTQPAWKDGADPRAVLAAWLTGKDNPYFARAAVNRVWSVFFGVGLVEPVDEMVGADHAPSHPELLDDLARSFAEHDFDLKYLILAVTSSRAYQLSSVRSHPSQDVPAQFARAPLLGMTAGQLFDSVTEATRYGPGGRGDGGARQEFLTKFSNLSDRPTEYQTSIIQALALMNGRLTADATSLERSQLLAAVLDSPFMSTPQRVETLYLATLTRRPTEKELARATKFIDAALAEGGKELSPQEKDARYKRALADVFWVLLNSGEFFFNH